MNRWITTNAVLPCLLTLSGITGSLAARTTPPESDPPCGPLFVRGDANFDLSLDIADPVALLFHVFLGDDPPPCSDAADANDDGVIDASDSVKLLDVLFLGGSFPAGTLPARLQTDPTDDDLICENGGAEPRACLYRSPERYTMGVLDGLDLYDAPRDRRLPILVRYPIEASGPRPVVLYSHGGAGSHNDRGKYKGQGWGAALSRSGYVVIHMAHEIRDLESHQALCVELDIAEEDCQLGGSNRYDRPLDASFVIDSLAEIEATFPQLEGLLDHERIVIAGHSAGTQTVMALAGARRELFPQRPFVDPRPMAFLACSPQGPDSTGFSSGYRAGSWDEIDRPLMTITGSGDSNGKPAIARTIPFRTMPPGDKYLFWLDDPTAKHSTFSLGNDDIDPDHLAWISSSGVAFLDAIVHGRQEAIEWLESDGIEVASGGLAAIVSK